MSRNWAHHVFRWDLDKTYLRSEFDSIPDLIKTALETASEKQAYPGATALLRTLGQDKENRICIVSGSPKQMRSVLAAKFALDGVRIDEFVLKDNLSNLLRGRFRSLRSQVPYKLPALLESRLGISGVPGETLFGDDSEADAIVYSLYADILAGAVDIPTLQRVMEAARAYDDDTERITSLASQVQRDDSVQRIIIHLESKTAPSSFTSLGKRVSPVYNYFQAALLLYVDGLLTARQVLFVASDMLSTKYFSVPSLANSLQDLIIRGEVTRANIDQLSSDASETTIGEAIDKASVDDILSEAQERVLALGKLSVSKPTVGPIDYVSLVDQEHESRQKPKSRLGRIFRR